MNSWNCGYIVLRWCWHGKRAKSCWEARMSSIQEYFTSSHFFHLTKLGVKKIGPVRSCKTAEYVTNCFCEMKQAFLLYPPKHWICSKLFLVKWKDITFLFCPLKWSNKKDLIFSIKFWISWGWKHTNRIDPGLPGLSSDPNPKWQNQDRVVAAAKFQGTALFCNNPLTVLISLYIHAFIFFKQNLFCPPAVGKLVRDMGVHEFKSMYQKKKKFRIYVFVFTNWYLVPLFNFCRMRMHFSKTMQNHTRNFLNLVLLLQVPTKWKQRQVPYWRRVLLELLLPLLW